MILSFENLKIVLSLSIHTGGKESREEITQNHNALVTGGTPAPKKYIQEKYEKTWSRNLAEWA